LRAGSDQQERRAQLDSPRVCWERSSSSRALIAQGANVVFVSRQLGHASPNTTLGIYAHLFDRAEHAKRTSDLLEAGFGQVLRG
jgi:site-specific recombinase XerD